MLVVLEAAIRKKEIARWIPFESSWFPPSCCRCLHHPHRELAGNGRSNPGNRVVEKRRGRISRSFFLKEFFFGVLKWRAVKVVEGDMCVLTASVRRIFVGGYPPCRRSPGLPEDLKSALVLWDLSDRQRRGQMQDVLLWGGKQDWGLVTAWNLASEVIVAAPAAG
ncbi:hypothetical protein MLD38_035253 [Melastoma candidum]|uniref:Uncharacterized protein n=1 Tax=Melastoma candidum TaxID=119954 RepID=A0ACB9MC72_9MYRT|nr:hypothetical protein MLD38_035253 [Melastoma candidum]